MEKINLQNASGIAMSSLSITTTLEAQLKRLNSIQDPVLRFSLFLESIRTAMTFGLIVAEIDLNSHIISSEVDSEKEDPKLIKAITEKNLSDCKSAKEKIDVIKGELGKYFDDFSGWIQTAQCPPDRLQMNDTKSVSGKHN